MEVENDTGGRKWRHLRNILERAGPFCPLQFEPGPALISYIRNEIKILVVGAGGLGCELLKDLAMMGFSDIHVIDMDTIDLSNLNRQFLFRQNDVGNSKANVAAEFINKRIPGCNVTPHFCKIQDCGPEFYQQFNIVICGLDSIIARRWINGTLLSLLRYDDDGELDQSSIIPLFDGGTEGFKGNVRVILPGLTACIECTLDLFPPQVSYPLCTIASTPRLPEHCIEYVKLIEWPKMNPFSPDTTIDGDDPQHINWIFVKSTERANKFGIPGVTYRLVQGVIKNIIPAVASTNAVVSAACVTEAFKLITSCCSPLDNYMVFNDADGVYTYTYAAEKKDDCLACSSASRQKFLDVPSTDITLNDLIEILREHPNYMMKNPAITRNADGLSHSLYISTVPALEKACRPNLDKTLSRLSIRNGTILIVTDSTTPRALEITIRVPNQ